ncbi:MAG TPA: ATP-dependent DNA helicase [Moraxellaceae bacterium]|nr:ATP-dependent DNA helicase [Moraxellaceae bacterium]
MTFTIAVRELVEFTAKTGDLDLRFTPAPSAQEGIDGHQMVQSRRGANYRAELPLTARHGPLTLRGRADGYDPDQGLLEEIKTFRGDLSRQPDNHRALHWAQARLYGAMLCASEGLSTLDIALVYLDVGTQKETSVTQSFTAAELQAFLDDHCERFLAWAEQEQRHRDARDEALSELRFPFPDFHPGQRQLAEDVYRGARDGACLLAQAPTGIGKTLGTMFPLLKAGPTQGLDRIFFLTAKTPGRALALEAARRLTDAGSEEPVSSVKSRIPLRVLELTARDKACVHPDKECHGDSCPLARGFYDRLPAARAAAVSNEFNDQPALNRIAAQHGICPYYLAQEMTRWSDLVVGDYNYFFDVSAFLHALTVQREWKVAVLCDEAHNLIDRAREMYSAELQPAALAALRKTAPASLRRPLGRLQKAWDALHDNAGPWHCLEALPTDLANALLGAIVKIAEHLTDHPVGVDAGLQRFYFDALHFQNLLDWLGPHSYLDVLTPASGTRALRLRNVVPAPHLRSRIAACHSLTLFSATLSPPTLHRDLLGLPADTRFVDVPSPFSPDQLQVHIVDEVSTRFVHRANSLVPIADLMARQFHSLPGNYLAFFSSHDYLQQVLATFRERHNDIPVREQARHMNETARDAFLAGFGPDTSGIAFAVLGGAFGEGIDLPGNRLIGAFVATLGLPQVNETNEKVRHTLQIQFGKGYDYAYLYPGVQKVVQAAGRVIRTLEDKGVVYLIDDRFSQDKIRALLPSWWQVASPG